MSTPGSFPQRTVCHGCRQVTHIRLEDEDDVAILRPMTVPGQGSIYHEISPGVMVERACPICGESDDPGWIPGFTPPV
ncbi:hypothetical protein [Actinocrispum wychmicini]|uniref:Uncharacterized protein n=1 Tax=Actinocrispum wychmicini TaxID=1213861 RepID=A0A4R2JYP2_9PSEU|nr:hypothetical protein [Actinocrispum wychmicini]TCO62526.1 hypothetical protein EV192_102665 [Actinocrispum wychmicini]